MESRQLRAFVAVARAASFTGAAVALHLSQSAVSQQVAALERELDARLFDRSGRRVVLTAAGAALLERAERLLADLEAARRAVAAAEGAITGPFRIASSLTIAGYVLPGPLTSFRHRHPDLRLELQVQNTEGVVRSLLAGEADLGLVEGPVDQPRIALEPLFEDELAVIASPEHPFASVEEIPPAQLLAEAFVVREPGSGTRQVAEDALSAVGVDVGSLHVVAELAGIEPLKAVVEAGLGVSIVSRLTVRRELALGTLVARPIQTVTLRRTLSAATLTGSERIPAASAFVGLLRGRRS